MLTYAILLFIAAILLIILEVFLPSGGVLGLLAAAAAVGSIVLAFKISQFAGTTFLIATLILGPTFIILGMKMFPKTPFGKRIIIGGTTETAKNRGTAGVSETNYSNLINKTGVTVTPLRPSGIIEINDERYSAVAQGSMIEQDKQITVIDVEGNNIVVEENA